LPGYVEAGVGDSLVCREDGSWHGEAITCVKVRCREDGERSKGSKQLKRGL
jgi:hypothetical protein